MPTPLDPELVDQIRESLYTGRGVRLFGDEPPVAKLDVLTPMTAEGEAFFSGKLDKVAELLDRGFIVNIDSDGSILARTPDNGSRYLSTQESEIDAMDRIMVKSALEQGATVAIEADGSLVIDAATTPKSVPPATAAAQFAEFERMADSGHIGSELAAGRDFQFEATAVPVSPAPLEDPFDSAAEVVAEADSLQLGVDVARAIAVPEYVTDKQEAEAQRMAAERQLAMTTAERDVSQRQAAAAQAEAISNTQFAAERRAKATTLREAGKVAEADAAEADAGNFDAIATVHVQTALTAQHEFDVADGRVAGEMAEVDRSTVASHEVNAEMSRFEKVFGEQEDQVLFARMAADELGEAERLEAALPDMETRGVAGLDRVRAAIAEHRATAESYVEKGNLRAATDIIGADQDATDPDVIDPDVIDLDVIDPTVDPAVPEPILTDPDDIDPEDTDPDDTDTDATEPDDTESDDTADDATEVDDTVTPDDTVVLEIPESDSFSDAPQFEERVDDINEMNEDLNGLTE